jgi:hypothetical protein
MNLLVLTHAGMDTVVMIFCLYQLNSVASSWGTENWPDISAEQNVYSNTLCMYEFCFRFIIRVVMRIRMTVHHFVEHRYLWYTALWKEEQ